MPEARSGERTHCESEPSELRRQWRQRQIVVLEKASMRVLSPALEERLRVMVVELSNESATIRTDQFLAPGSMVQILVGGSAVVGTIRYCVGAGRGFSAGVSIENLDSSPV